LSERLGISRTSLREAFSTLQGLGLIVPRPGKGVYVAEKPSPSAQPWRFADSHSLTDIYQLRFALENFTARLAALVVEPADIEALRANAEAMQA
ncbi:FadR/GntR family transcriptional regulator, partial [Salmonella enterica]|uniref:FadR/GntR family transcriptional regulator n=1 Tax=Salmonella enterica TaxID=28901 RepID=UPI0020A3C762